MSAIKRLVLVRVETRNKGLLSVHSQHRIFKTESGARNYISRIQKKHPECKCRIFFEGSTEYSQESLNLDQTDF